MTPESQQIAIVEAFGWKRITPPEPWMKEPDWTKWEKDGRVISFEELPDCLNDLNVMHEAEEELFERNDWSACAYEEELRKITTSWPWFATASQRAEAFLKSLNLWDDSK